jgi:hypothetical protein
MDRHREITKFHAFLRGAEQGRRRIVVSWRRSHKSPPALAEVLGLHYRREAKAILACGEADK